MRTTEIVSRNLRTKNRADVLRVQLMARETAERIGRRIRQRRLEMGLDKQRYLAELMRAEDPSIAVDNQRISDWERGVNTPSDRHLQLLAKVLKRDVAWFYEETTQEELFEGASAAEISRLQSLLDRLEVVVGRLESIGGVTSPGEAREGATGVGFAPGAAPEPPPATDDSDVRDEPEADMA